MPSFIILAVGVLVISLTSIWPFIILTIGGSTHITDWCLDLYYTNFWSSVQVTDWYLGLYYAYCCSSAQVTDWYLALYDTYYWMLCSNH
jgi:hypothetical protein